MSWLPGYSLEEWEKLAIQSAMKYCRGNKTHAAATLQCSVRTIDAKLEKYAQEDLHAEQREHDRREKAAVDLQRARGLDQASISARMGIQPVSQISPQQSVSLSEREEIQGVLPGPTPGRGNRRRG